jgi:protein-S-isoprenylcysteine O-methyltransferase Ste14
LTELNTISPKSQEKLAPLFFVIAALATMVIGWFTRSSFPISCEISKPVGEAIFLIGMIAFIWTIVHLKKAFLGDVAPVTENLITHGPYRWLRHPIYLCMIIVLVGIGIAFRSLWGIISVFAIFLLAVIHRARLEESALAEKFGSAWDEYANQTNFLIPFLW